MAVSQKTRERGRFAGTDEESTNSSCRTDKKRLIRHSFSAPFGGVAVHHYIPPTLGATVDRFGGGFILFYILFFAATNTCFVRVLALYAAYAVNPKAVTISLNHTEVQRSK